MNAKREHLRARIGVVLGFQAYFGAFCETIGTVIRRLSRNNRWLVFWRRVRMFPSRYHLNDLEIRCESVVISQHLNPTFYSPISADKQQRFVLPQWSSTASTNNVGTIEEVKTQTGYYYHDHEDDGQDQNAFQDDEQNRLIRRTDEIRDLIEESTTRIHSEIRKVVVEIQDELEDIKRHFMNPLFQ